MNITRRLQVLKFEGSSLHKSLTCSIVCNHKQIYSSFVSTLPIERREFELSASSILEIRLRDPQKADILGLNVPIHLLKVSHQWLPLFFASKIETLTSLPDEVSTPRILLKVSFRDFPDENDDTCEAAHKAADSDSPSLASEESLNVTSNSKKKFLMLDILAKELETSHEKVGQLSKKVEELENRLKNADQQFYSCHKQAGDRERQLLDVISAKDGEIQQSIKSNFSLQSKLRLAENEKDNLLDQLQRKELEIERLKDLTRELETVQNKLHRAEGIQDQLTKALQNFSKSIDGAENLEFKQELLIKDQEVKMLKGITEEVKKSGDTQIASLTKELKETKSQLATSQEQERYLASKLLSLEAERMSFDPQTVIAEFVEKEFVALAKKHRISYMKINEFTFLVKGTAVNIALCHGGLFVKVASRLIKLEDFLEDKQDTSITRPESSLSIRTDRSENITHRPMSKISSQKSFLKSTKSSASKLKPINDKSTLQERNRILSIDRKAFR